MTEYGAKVALLGGIIDYAGTFPPAALPLEGALRRAATFRREARHPWLLSKVILPLAEIKKLTPAVLYQAGGDGTPWLYGALGGVVEKPEDFERTLEWDLREVRRLNDRRFDSSCRQWVVSYEVKLGEAVAGLDPGPLLSRLRERAPGVGLYFELGWQGEWKRRLLGFAESLVAWQEEAGKEAQPPGLKFRTGGKETPSFEELSYVVALCTRLGLRFKATQGLHHPVTGEHGFGFLNLFAALSFAQALGEEEFPEKTLFRCLGETDATAFQFSKDTFQWKEFALPVDTLEEARRLHGATFGSCSLDEPDEYLEQIYPEPNR